MTDLVTWLREQLDEDEQLARECDGDAVVDWVADETEEHGEEAGGRHIARHLPSRVLAEVSAKRQLLDGHDGIHRCIGGDYMGGSNAPDDVVEPCRIAEVLAQPYAYRPGYLEEWRPA